jgi:hypothetical protein
VRNLPGPGGVAPAQPWRWKQDAKQIYTWALLAAAVLGFLYLGFAIAGGRIVDKETVEIPPGAKSGAPEAAVFLGPMEVKSAGNLRVNVRAPVSNSWIYLDGALINEATGAVDPFDVEVSYYSGRDSDGTWTEGSNSRSRFIAAVPAGRYLMRLAPQWGGGTVSRYDVTVRSHVPRFYHALLAVLAVVGWPVLLAWKQMRFEFQRWSESDHPWVESSED